MHHTLSDMPARKLEHPAVQITIEEWAQKEFTLGPESHLGYVGLSRVPQVDFLHEHALLSEPCQECNGDARFVTKVRSK